MNQPQNNASWEIHRIVLAVAVFIMTGGIGFLASLFTLRDGAGFAAFLFAVGSGGVAWCLPQVIVSVLRRGRPNGPKN